MSTKTVLILLIVALSSCNHKSQTNYIQFIDQKIGTNTSTTLLADGSQQIQAADGQTIIGISAPFGMTQWTPQSQSGQQKCVAPYYYGNIYTEGFRATHWLNGACEKDYGSISILPSTLSQELKFLPTKRPTFSLIYFEDISPAYMSVGFVQEQLLTEVTGSKRCGLFRFSWLAPVDPVIMIYINNDYDKGFIHIDLENQEIVGYNPVSKFYRNKGESAGIAGYFVAKFSMPINEYGTFGNFEKEKGSTTRKDQRQIGAYVSFQPENSEPILLKVGTSFTSIENARKNLETEIEDWNFNATKNKLEKQWNEMLGRIDIETTDSLELSKFYTALYHSLLHPRLMSDVNGDYPVFNAADRIQNSGEFNYYDDFDSWNTSRAQMPLLSLIAPEEYKDMIASLLQKAKDGNWLPASPLANNFTMASTGDYSSSIIADAAAKGFDFDYKLAYNYLKKNATDIPTAGELNDGKGRPGSESYLTNGFIPLEEPLMNFPQTESQVARVLEYSYNDWCVAQLANRLGENADFNKLLANSMNFTNVFDEDREWMNGCYADGSFVTDFDPDQAQPFFNNRTSRQYTWYVPHSVPTLIELLGGKAQFEEKLSSFLNSAQYKHADAISQHVPYLFNYTGDWATTQKLVKAILTREYGADVGGLSGHDNAGQLSAWYVLSSMGFYPTCPGSNEYQLSSPIFKKATLHLNKKYYSGKRLILSTDQEAKSIIFNQVTLNNKTIGNSITHRDIQLGGELHFSKKQTYSKE
ncbi:GH92 family glycosyl hydrolase [uncultured Draconibacterium sp.]|uniref:GH92 family glycosyl hydrolase n=1 Tax=uncultured Draconibacterium sp. TaxID=1573823 RepID=UPI0032173026